MKKVRLIISIVIFIMAFVLPALAVWRYTGYHLTRESYRISASVCYSVIAGSLILFYNPMENMSRYLAVNSQLAYKTLMVNCVCSILSFHRAIATGN